MKDPIEEMAYDLNEAGNDKNSQRHQASFDSKSKRKILLLVALGILLLIVIIAIFPREASKVSKKDLTSIQLRLSHIEENLMRLEVMDDKVIVLEKQGKGLQQSMARLDRSKASLTQRLDALSEKIDQLQKKIASAALKSRVSRAVREKKAAQSKRRYHQIRRGDTLYHIAKRYGTSVDELRRINNLAKEQDIYPGQRLLIAPSSHE